MVNKDVMKTRFMRKEMGGLCKFLAVTFLALMPCILMAQTVDVVGNPEIVNVNVGDNFTITIQLDATGANVTVADIYMTFDPSMVQVNSAAFASGAPFTISTFPPQAPDNVTGTWARGGFGFAPATSLVDYILVECTAIGSGTALMEHVVGGLFSTTLAYAGEDVTGQLNSIEINVVGIVLDCPALWVNNGDPCLVDDLSGEYVGCECLIYDCNNIPGGTAYLDDCDICVEGDTGLEPCLNCDPGFLKTMGFVQYALPEPFVPAMVIATYVRLELLNLYPAKWFVFRVALVVFQILKELPNVNLVLRDISKLFQEQYRVWPVLRKLLKEVSVRCRVSFAHLEVFQQP